MANKEHVALLRQGVEVWNTWRRENPNVEPDLSGAELSRMYFRGVDLSKAVLIQANLCETNLHEANLSEANLNEADLSGAVLWRTNFSGAYLIRADLSKADLSKADLSRANLYEADLISAYVNSADLSGTDISGTDLNGAHILNTDLSRADLSGADLTFVNFNKANLDTAELSKAELSGTLFTDIDLSTVVGLDTVIHRSPSSIGIDTLIRSQGKIPEAFLRGCGVPDIFIEYLPSLIGAMQPIQFYSCFISYSSQDKAFARRLHERMRAEHLRVWFAPEDVKGGEKLNEQIEQAIQMHDRLLLILSEQSIRSAWVQRELRRARKAELASGRRKLFPIRLTDFAALHDWECVDSEGNDLAEEVRQYFIPDFSNWKEHDAFEAAFARLLRDLKLTNAAPVPALPKQEGQVAPTLEHINRQQRQLEAHRSTLASYLERRAILGKAHAPPEIRHGINDARKEIARIKAFLRANGVDVVDLPDDEE